MYGQNLSEYTILYFLPLSQSFAPLTLGYNRPPRKDRKISTVADTIDAFLFSPVSQRKRVRHKDMPTPSAFQAKLVCGLNSLIMVTKEEG